ncbi:MAG: hypothetical protein WCG50_10305 [Rhodoferax sp.]|uniref:hypothetical protein n=1 Tax=Rhodoferax sp. TaxID=50421 RepID=UPI0030174B00
MKQALKQILVATCVLLAGSAALAKFPAISDEAKAKAAETSAKTAWSGKVDAYLLCKSQDKVVAHYKKTKPAANSACVDPGPFVYLPLVASATPTASVTTPASSASVAPAKKP